MARVELQRFWRLTYKASIGGMGHMNPDPHVNGEERELARFASEIASRGTGSPVVFDIGANEGDFTAAILSLVPDAHVHCFEPHPATAGRLAARFATDARVTVNAVGVGSETGVLTLHDYPGGTGSAHASLLDDAFSEVWHAPAETIEVPITTVDGYVAAANLDRVDLVKIDVEGFERNVLLGMHDTLHDRTVDRVQFEFNAHNALNGFTLHEVGSLLDGFDIYKLLSNGRLAILGPDVAYDSAIEVFMYANYVALRRGLATSS